ncbi:transposable element Tcb1 transposase [Trichonephila clavipes]|nr:transposable element Tcb1 transposase [Trichonephila clavipes]
MPSRRFRRQYEQLSQFQKGRIIGMMDGWSARRVARRLGRSDCVGVRGSERCHLHEDQAQDALDRPTFGITAPITCAARDAYPSTPPGLDWCRARGNWTAAEWNQVVFSDESRFNLSSDDNRVRVRRPRGEGLNPAFALQRHTARTAGGVQDNARPHTARISQDCLHTVTNPSLACPIPRFASNRAYLRSFGTESWASQEFERTRGKVTANMERNVSRHHTGLVCLNARSYRIVHSR